jgi:hypothetical protein
MQYAVAMALRCLWLLGLCELEQPVVGPLILRQRSRDMA